MKYILLFLIKIYQATLSLDHGLAGKLFPNTRVCIYHPSCSMYGYESIKKYGTFIGVPMATWRILRCGPWSQGGYDPVKEIELPKWVKWIVWI